MVEESTSIFLEAAELEYECLTRYCDAYSKLSHAVSDAKKREPLDQLGVHVGGTASSGGVSGNGSAGGGQAIGSSTISQRSDTFDRITATFQRSELPFAASQMFDQIEAVRDAHAYLLDSLDDIVDAINEADAAISGVDSPDDADGSTVRHTARQRQLLKKHAALKSHTELSQRVVKTVCSSGVGTPIIYPNGMLATDDTDDDGTTTQHQRRIVALAALRAGIARAKKEVGA